MMKTARDFAIEDSREDDGVDIPRLTKRYEEILAHGKAIGIKKAAYAAYVTVDNLLKTGKLITQDRVEQGVLEICKKDAEEETAAQKIKGETDL